MAKNQIYNLEGEEKISIRHIADTVKDILGNVEISHIEGRKGDFSGKEISNQKAKKDLGWAPHTSFKDGVTKYVEWCNSHKKDAEPVVI